MNNIPHVVDTGASVMNNEPVAWRNLCVGNIGEDSEWIYNEIGQGEPLYTHPAKTEKYIADLKNLVDAQGQDGTWNSNQYMLGLFNGLEFALSIFESREPKFRELTAKTLTDEEIVSLYKETEADNGGIREFARAILKKASEK